MIALINEPPSRRANTAPWRTTKVRITAWWRFAQT